MSLTADQIQLIERFPLGMVASVRPDGGPAVSPKGTFHLLGKTQLAYADIRSPKTRSNLEADARTEITFLDPFARKSVRISGTAAVHYMGSETFQILLPQWKAKWPELASRIGALVVIEIETAEMIYTPPYNSGTTEEEMIAAYKAKYSEIYP